MSGGQQHVARAAEFWVFCADFNRLLQICPDAQLGLAEQLLLGAVDTAMMAQNALVAAESLGLGGVYIGGIRNSIEEVTELLKLPQHVLPLFGLCLGWPADNPEVKPRMPAAMLVHENAYQPVDEACWRNMMSRWRNTTCRAAATPAAIPGATIFAALSLKKVARLFSNICISRGGQRADCVYTAACFPPRHLVHRAVVAQLTYCRPAGAGLVAEVQGENCYIIPGWNALFMSSPARSRAKTRPPGGNPRSAFLLYERESGGLIDSL
jgi:hypothetical protein